jgi:hypothetical protein
MHTIVPATRTQALDNEGLVAGLSNDADGAATSLEPLRRRIR